MHSVTHLQGRYEVKPGLAEPWLLYVCNSHYEVDKQNHNSSNAEVFPETQGLTRLSTLCCSICCQSKTLYNQNLCSLHSINILDRNCQIPCDSVSTRVSTFHTPFNPLQSPLLNDCFVCKSCSRSIALSRAIQFPSELNCQFSAHPFMQEMYEAIVTKFLCEMA